MIRDYPQSAETLRTLFEIIEQTDLTRNLSKAFGTYINNTGNEILNSVKSSMDEKTLVSFIDKIITLKVQTDSLLLSCFKARKMFK